MEEDDTPQPTSDNGSEYETQPNHEEPEEYDSLNFGFVRGFFEAVVGAMTLTSPPLYRYPYRNTLEAFRSDWKHIRRDIESAQQHHEGHPYE